MINKETSQPESAPANAEQIEQRNRQYAAGKRELKSIRWMLFFIIAAQLVITMLTTLIASFMTTPPHPYLQVGIASLIAYSIPILFYAHAHKVKHIRQARDTFRLHRIKPQLLPLVLLIGAGAQMVMILLNLPFSFLFKTDVYYTPTAWWELTAGILVVGIIPAIFEEFMFRGILYGTMSELSTRAAAIFTTVMFALLHANPAGFLGYLFMGGVSIVLLRRTGSLVATVLFHFAVNTAALLMEYYSAFLFDFPMTMAVLFLGGILVFAAAMTIFCGVTKPQPETGRKRTSSLLGQNFFSLPVLLCILGVIFLVIYTISNI